LWSKCNGDGKCNGDCDDDDGDFEDDEGNGDCEDDGEGNGDGEGSDDWWDEKCTIIFLRKLYNFERNSITFTHFYFCV